MNASAGVLFHLWSSWIIKPRTLCDNTHSKAWSPTHKFGRSGLLRKKQINISLHFFALSFIRLLDTHASTDWVQILFYLCLLILAGDIFTHKLSLRFRHIIVELSVHISYHYPIDGLHLTSWRPCWRYNTKK